jgi:hypothetical protein
MNTTQDPMPDMADTLRQAMNAAGETVRPETIRELPDWRPARPASRARIVTQRALIPLSAAAAIALIAVLASLVTTGTRHGHPAGSTTAVAGAAAPAPFFLAIDTAHIGSFGLAVYSAVTGRLVAPIQDSSFYAASALGNNDTFLVADASEPCRTTKLYRLTLTSQGKPSSLTPLAIPPINGTVTALAASADGSTIGYATQFCTKTSSSPGAVGIIHPGTGQTAQWSVPAPGQSITNLSITANGRMISYAGAPNKVTGPTSGQSLPVRTIRLLPTDAPPGTAAARSRAVVTISRLSPAGIFDAATISADGGTLYFCTQTGSRSTSLSALRGYDVATGTTSVLRYFGRGSVTCSLGLSGQYLLAGTGQNKSSLIKYDVATGRSAPVPVPTEWGEVTGTIPW